MANIGFVGLGSLGSQITKRLIDAGHDVTGYNRTKAKGDWLVEAGMQWSETPRAVAEATDITFSMVRDTDALYAVTGGENGIVAGLSEGKIYADMSTVNPLASRKIADQVAETGAQMLDTPVSGSKITLAAGKMSIMVGGDEKAYETIKPVLLDIGPTVSYMGPIGSAAAIKVAINLTLPIQILAFSEGVLLAEKFGIDRDTAIDVMLKSVSASPATSYRLPMVLKEPEEVLFDMNMMQKDIQLALDMGRELEVPMITSALSNEMLTTARAVGLAEKDFASLFEVLAQMAGTS